MGSVLWHMLRVTNELDYGVSLQVLRDSDFVTAIFTGARNRRTRFRNLLKAVVKHIGKEDSKRHFREHVTNEFRKNLELLFSYNIAVDRSEEMKRTLGKSAASVGLQLPEVYEP
uniref:Uncharacterized protein n=1 Tax=Cannabis sativa TaxID=3483 RepID=A0A803Q9P3_CANSA